MSGSRCNTPQDTQQHSAAFSWFEGLNGETASFCRVTQLSFLRLVSHPGVMGEDVRSQTEAWQAYDTLLADERVIASG